MYSAAYITLGGNAALMSSMDSSLDVIRKGLPISMVDTAIQLLDMKKADFTSLIGLNIGNLPHNKQDKQQRLTPTQSEHTLMIVQLFVKSCDYFGDRPSALTWLNEPAVAFVQKAPIDLLDSIAGIKTVAEALNRLSHGMTA